MVYFVIGVPKIQGNRSASIDRVNTSLASHGKLYTVEDDFTKYIHKFDIDISLATSTT